MLSELRKDLGKIADPKKTEILQKFFQTNKGGYGEGDVFLGPTVPQLRKITIKYRQLSIIDVQTLLKSKFHEERMIALFILVDQFNRGDEKVQKKIFDFYLKNTRYINNWDLVDCSADRIVGGYLFERSKDLLFTLVKSKNLWERRISIVATYYFIKNRQLEETFSLAKILISDRTDLIQKATGWMLREAGKKDEEVLHKFLKKNYKKMGRTALRYSIEKFSQPIRQSYLKGKV